MGVNEKSMNLYENPQNIYGKSMNLNENQWAIDGQSIRIYENPTDLMRNDLKVTLSLP